MHHPIRKANSARNNQFLEGYLEGVLFTEMDEDDQPLDRNYGMDDFSREALKWADEDCWQFQRDNAEYLENVEDMNMAGYHFLLNRNGHGSGYWDHEDEYEYAQELSQSADGFHECNAYVDDNGQISLQ